MRVADVWPGRLRGALDVLRNGLKDSGVKFRLAYFRPASGLNEETRRLHAANLFAVVRQVHFSTKNEKSLDLVLFLNGIPVFTAELKNPLTDQKVGQVIQEIVDSNFELYKRITDDGARNREAVAR